MSHVLRGANSSALATGRGQSGHGGFRRSLRAPLELGEPPGIQALRRGRRQCDGTSGGRAADDALGDHAGPAPSSVDSHAWESRTPTRIPTGRADGAADARRCRPRTGLRAGALRWRSTGRPTRPSVVPGTHSGETATPASNAKTRASGELTTARARQKACALSGVQPEGRRMSGWPLAALSIRCPSRTSGPRKGGRREREASRSRPRPDDCARGAEAGDTSSDWRDDAAGRPRHEPTARTPRTPDASRHLGVSRP